MSPERDDWEKAREEREEREAAQEVIEAAAEVRRTLGEQEWERVRRIHQLGLWSAIAGALAVGLTLLALLGSVAQPYISRVAPSVMGDWKPPLGGGLTLLGAGLGVGIPLLVVGWVSMRSAEGRVRRAAGSEERAAMVLGYLGGGAEMWEKIAGEGREAADGYGGGEKGRAPAQGATGSVRGAVPRDKWDSRHWLLVEVSGAHLVWWLSFIGARWYTRDPLPLSPDRLPSPAELEAMLESLPPEWLVNGVLAIAVVGFVLKVMIPLVLLSAWAKCGSNPETRREITRYYRFWAKGLLPAALALLPGLAPWAIGHFFP